LALTGTDTQWWRWLGCLAVSGGLLVLVRRPSSATRR
jgi:LPXTG-motif cell wall-anchored protein